MYKAMKLSWLIYFVILSISLFNAFDYDEFCGNQTNNDVEAFRIYVQNARDEETHTKIKPLNTFFYEQNENICVDILWNIE